MNMKLIASYRWADWVRKIAGSNLKLQENHLPFRRFHKIFSNLTEENRKMSTCNRLALETLGSRLIRTKILPGLQCMYHSLQWPDKQEIGRWQVPKCPSRPTEAEINGELYIYMPAPCAGQKRDLWPSKHLFKSSLEMCIVDVTTTRSMWSKFHFLPFPNKTQELRSIAEKIYFVSPRIDWDEDVKMLQVNGNWMCIARMKCLPERWLTMLPSAWVVVLLRCQVGLKFICNVVMKRALRELKGPWWLLPPFEGEYLWTGTNKLADTYLEPLGSHMVGCKYLVHLDTPIHCLGRTGG